MLSKRLREVRLTYGISQKKLGVLAGLPENTAGVRINQYEKGKHIPDFLTLQRIGKVLGYPLEFFYAEDDMVAEIIHLISKLSVSNKQEVLNLVKFLAFHRDQTNNNNRHSRIFMDF